MRLLLALVFSARAAAAYGSGCSIPDRPLIAEIGYDAAGDDTGKEFVELFNKGPVAVPLAGLRLEAGDGSGPGRWSLRWTGGPGDSVRAGARFVIGGAAVQPAPHALADLDLQNGPDAVRLVWPDGRSEVVGYGALEFPEYSCGAPAEDAASGLSLARVPDDADLGANALDFRAAAPSPGAPNQPRRNLALRSRSLRVEPERPLAGEAAALHVTLVNQGSGTLAEAEGALLVRENGDEPPVLSVALPALAAQETLAIARALPPLPAGKHLLRAVASLPDDEVRGDDVDSIRVRVGPGPLQLTEIQFHPGAGEGEWIEVVNLSAAPLDVASFRWSDRGGALARPEEGRPPLRPDSLGILAQSRAQLLLRFPSLDTSRVWQASPWPSLNNTDGEDGFADLVTVRELDGTLSDQIAYSARGILSGSTLERQDEVWLAGPSAGSPLSFPRRPQAVSGGFEVAPSRVVAPGRAALLRWDLPWPKARVAIDLYDLAGRPRGAAMAERPSPARGEQLWDPGSLPPGIYVAVLRARSDSGPETLSLSRAVRVETP